MSKIALDIEFLTEKADDRNPVAIYVLINPLNNKIFYVGSTYLSLSCTLRRHINNVNSQTPSKGKIIRKISAKGLKPIIKIIDRCRVNQRSGCERAWIEELSEKYKLVNAYFNL